VGISRPSPQGEALRIRAADTRNPRLSARKQQAPRRGALFFSGEVPGDSNPRGAKRPVGISRPSPQGDGGESSRDCRKSTVV